jgi:hypothetical protein
MLYLAALLIGVAFGQSNCTNYSDPLVSNDEYAYGESGQSQYVIDIWNGAFILPLVIDNKEGTTACLAGDILFASSIQYICNDAGDMITKKLYNNGDCSGFAYNEYSWSTGWTPMIDVVALQTAGDVVIDSVNGTSLEVTAGSGNLFDFNCAGKYAAVTLKMGVVPGSCTTTVYGAIGGGCMATDEPQGKLQVSCDCDGAYLTSFVQSSASATTGFTGANVCENNIDAGNFACNMYSAGDTCDALLTADVGGTATTLYAMMETCTACKDSAQSLSFSVIIIAIYTIFAFIQ